MSKKVLILSEAVGAGHTKAAEGLSQGITHLAPSVQIEMLEVGNVLRPFITKMIVHIYLKMIVLFPFLWGKLYEFKQNKPLSKWMKFIIYQLLHSRLETVLNHEKPQLIICTHPFCASSVSRAKRLGLPVTICTIITDFHVHGAWVHPEVDIYLVSSQHVLDQLIHMGVPQNRILITGIPVRSNFWVKQDKRQMRERLKLKEIPTVMIMGGGLGIGGIQQLAYRCLKWKEHIQIIICTGNNKRLAKSLRNDPQFHHPHIHILGFVSRIDEWMDATDILITKPGGITCYEALVKRLPLYIYQPIPGHEERNCEFLLEHNFAVKIEQDYQIDHYIEKLLSLEPERDILQQKIQQFQKKIDPLASARCIVNMLMKAEGTL